VGDMAFDAVVWADVLCGMLAEGGDAHQFQIMVHFARVRTVRCDQVDGGVAQDAILRACDAIDTSAKWGAVFGTLSVELRERLLAKALIVTPNQLTDMQLAMLEEWKPKLLTRIMECVCTSNRVLSLNYKFHNLMNSISRLMGGWISDSIGASKFKECFAYESFKMFILQNVPLIKALKRSFENTSYDEARAIVMAHPRYIFEGGALLDMSHLRTSLSVLLSRIKAYIAELDLSLAVLAALMGHIRRSVQARFPSFCSGESHWCAMPIGVARGIIADFEALFAKDSPVEWLRGVMVDDFSASNFNQRCKVMLMHPFEKHDLDGGAHAKNFVVTVCLFVDGTLFRHDRASDHALYALNMEGGRQAAKTNGHLLSIFTDRSGVFSARQAGCRVPPMREALHELTNDIASHIAEIDTRQLSGEYRDDDPHSPLFWTIENFACASHTFASIGAHPRAPGWREAPQYHCVASHVSPSRRADSVCHGYQSTSGATYAVQHDRDISFDCATLQGTMGSMDLVELTMYRPISIDMTMHPYAGELCYAACSRKMEGRHLAELCGETRSVPLQTLWGHGPVDHDALTSVYLHEVVRGGWGALRPFSPFCVSGGENNPDIANELQQIGCHEQATKHVVEFRQEGIQLYCMRAWMQMYTILNGISMRGPCGRLVVPYNHLMNKRRPDTIMPEQWDDEPVACVALAVVFPTLDDMRRAVSKGLRARDTDAVKGIQLPFGATVNAAARTVRLLYDPSQRELASLRQVICIFGEHGGRATAEAAAHRYVRKTVVFTRSMSVERESNLWEFVFLCTLLRLAGGATELGSPCEGGMASLAAEERRLLLPRIVKAGDVPSALYDLPIWNLTDSSGRRSRLAVDLSNPEMFKVARVAFVLTQLQTFSITACKNDTRYNRLVMASDQGAEYIAGDKMVHTKCPAKHSTGLLRVLLSRLTFNPIRLATDATSKFEVHPRDMGLHINQSTQVPKLQNSKDMGTLLLTSPFLTAAPLVVTSSLSQEDGTFCVGRLDRMLYAFRPYAMEKTKDILIRLPPLFNSNGSAVMGSEASRLVVVHYWEFMRMGGGERGGFLEVAGADSRVEQCHGVPTREDGLARPIPLPFNPIGWEMSDLEVAVRAGGYRTVIIERHKAGDVGVMQLDGWRSAVLDDEWLLVMAPGWKVDADPDAMHAIRENIGVMRSGNENEIDAVMYLARFCIQDREVYDASLRHFIMHRYERTMVDPEDMSFDRMYRRMALHNTIRVIQNNVRTTFETIDCESLAIDREQLAREVGELTDPANLREVLTSRATMAPVSAFLQKMMCLQLLANTITRPLGEDEGFNRTTEQAKMHEHIAMAFQVLVDPTTRRGDHVNDTSVYYKTMHIEHLVGYAFPRVLMCVTSFIMLDPPTYSLQMHGRPVTSGLTCKRKREQKDITAKLTSQLRAQVTRTWDPHGSMCKFIIPDGYMNTGEYVLNLHRVQTACNAVQTRISLDGKTLVASARRINMVHLYMGAGKFYEDRELDGARYAVSDGSVTVTDKREPKGTSCNVRFSLLMSTRAGGHDSPYVFDMRVTGATASLKALRVCPTGDVEHTLELSMRNPGAPEAEHKATAPLDRSCVETRDGPYTFYTQQVVGCTLSDARGVRGWSAYRQFVRCVVDRNGKLVQVQQFCLVGFNPP
jgi:hypothetical protein